MDRLRLAAADGSAPASGSDKPEKMSESRKKELRKMSQKRRSSKQSNIDHLTVFSSTSLTN